MLVATVLTGMMTLAADKHAGPLASFYAAVPVAASSREGPSDHPMTSGNRGPGAGEGTVREEGVLREFHETLANLTLILIGFHLAGVVLASFVHRENLILAMITGRKRGATG
jgi:cytochrome b